MEFASFLILLAEIEDPRRAEGKQYRLPHVVLFAILAMLAGANSYRSIHSFIDVHFTRLRKFFRLKWSHAPAYTTIRNILRQLDAALGRRGIPAPCRHPSREVHPGRPAAHRRGR